MKVYNSDNLDFQIIIFSRCISLLLWVKGQKLKCWLPAIPTYGIFPDFICKVFKKDLIVNMHVFSFL